MKIDYAYLITMFSIVFGYSLQLYQLPISRYSKTDFTLMILIGSLLSKNMTTIPWLRTSSAMFSKELILMQASLTSAGFSNSFKFLIAF